MWPVNLNLGPATLRYATAQLLCKLDDPQTYVFFAWPGVAPEFAFEEKEGATIQSANARITRNDGIAYVSQIEPGTQIAINVHNQNGSDLKIVVLSRDQAFNVWKSNLAGKDRLLLSSDQLYFDHDQVHVSTIDNSEIQVGVFPALEHDPAGFAANSSDGVFRMYSAPLQNAPLEAQLHKSQELGADPPVKMGKEVAMAPEESAYDTAAKWTIDIPPGPAQSHVFVKINYVGDVARIYSHGKLITDNFYNGTPWIVGLTPTANSGDKPEQLQVEILPFHEHSPIYLPKGASPTFPPSGLVADIQKVEVLIEHDAVMDLKP
jgi:hypothetical protein